MTDPLPTPGEQREARRSRLQMIIIIAAVLLGGAIGGSLAVSTPGDGSFLEAASWPPLLSIALAVVALIVVPLLMLSATRTADELEYAHQAWGMQAGGFALLCGYPAWFALWKGGFVPEPAHGAIYAGYFVLTIIAYLYHRFR
ncbi:hypothetical protein [Sphingomicrobium arenosum]|uniref:hypothetical protein n=1 Tax=Sphingomicrobium arenosum TaxID=2233861 RepID=UPI00223EB47B|nr:hypothetical protein [Sphingomicrobium arenosum]